ncbi:hypothetical protein [Aeromicrobium sp.]|uniref:hypothetical protein n=1 Tax=Aeromicrobium sp. TaxID=1871063 RepID=UPI0025B7D62D|nr:hypothetical protein [Aeromicrobium sp.]
MIEFLDGVCDLFAQGGNVSAQAFVSLGLEDSGSNSDQGQPMSEIVVEAMGKFGPELSLTVGCDRLTVLTFGSREPPAERSVPPLQNYQSHC